MNEIKQNSLKAWIKAARPITLTGALIPVLLATALAHHNDCMQPKVAVLCALFACGMQIVANMVNDIIDFLKGTDREDRLGPPRACAQGWILPSTMNIGIAFILLLSLIFGVGILSLCLGHLLWGGIELVAIGLFCVIFSFLYTTRLSYLGWGDLLVVVFFGLVPVAGTYYAQSILAEEPGQAGSIAQHLPNEMWLLALISGIAIDSLLIVNNFRDREQDRISGKNTPIARFGAWFAYLQHLLITVVVALMITTTLTRMGSTTEHWSQWAIAPGYTGGQAVILYSMFKINKGKQLNALLASTSVVMTLMAVLLSIAIW